MAADKSGARVAVALCGDGRGQGGLYLQVELVGLSMYVGVWWVVVEGCAHVCTDVHVCACGCMEARG